ncbi:hypothetical protein [Lachnospira multipara]|uniref:hypothetical protein n=1 Tax=Lachnospira multipara TaxID=28051 RepID=UPI00040BC523|nr:hypothetical protein [Lachnospira multipara]
MSGEVLGFTIWIIVGFGIMLLGIIDIFSKKPAGFWANSKPFEVKDVKGYNRATGLLFIAYGLVFNLLGLPILMGHNNPYIILSMVGVMFETIAIMVIYSLVITKKYKK